MEVEPAGRLAAQGSVDPELDPAAVSVDEELALRGAERFEERAVGIEKVSATEPDEE